MVSNVIFIYISERNTKSHTYHNSNVDKNNVKANHMDVNFFT